VAYFGRREQDQLDTLGAVHIGVMTGRYLEEVLGCYPRFRVGAVISHSCDGFIAQRSPAFVERVGD
jgi:hypothetical protein